MQITLLGVTLMVLFLGAGLAYTTFSGPNAGELVLLAFGPVLLCTNITAQMIEGKLSLLQALKACFSFKTSASNALILLLILWSLVVLTDMNTCHLGREQEPLQAKHVHLKIKLVNKQNSKKP